MTLASQNYWCILAFKLNYDSIGTLNNIFGWIHKFLNKKGHMKQKKSGYSTFIFNYSWPLAPMI